MKEFLLVTQLDLFLLVREIQKKVNYARNLLDRFGMHAQIGTVKEPNLRVQIVEQRASFDAAPMEFRQKYQDSHKINYQKKLLKHENFYHKFKLTMIIRVKISQICSELDVDGLRGDLVTNRASKSIAAFEGRNSRYTGRYLSRYSTLFTT